MSYVASLQLTLSACDPWIAVQDERMLSVSAFYATSDVFDISTDINTYKTNDNVLYNKGSSETSRNSNKYGDW